MSEPSVIDQEADDFASEQGEESGATLTRILHG